MLSIQDPTSPRVYNLDPETIRRARLTICSRLDATDASAVMEALGLVPYRHQPPPTHRLDEWGRSTPIHQQRTPESRTRTPEQRALKRVRDRASQQRRRTRDRAQDTE